MAERLIIDNFAGIEHLELDLKKINILIGPQAVGKSICAKLLYYFKGFVGQLSAGVWHTGDPIEDFRFSLVRKFESYFSPSSWSAGEFRVRYELGDGFIQVHGNGDPESGLKLDYSKFFDTELRSFHRRIVPPRGEESDEHKLDFGAAFLPAYLHLRNTIANKLGWDAFSDQIFIPAGRSFFAYVQKGMFSLMKSGYTADPFIMEFGSFYERIGTESMYSVKRVGEKPTDDIRKLVRSILCGEHIRQKDEDFIRLDDGRVTTLAYSSSGQQEMLPLARVLELLPYMAFPEYGYSVCVEEPEAHLFPTAQRSVVELLAMVFNVPRVPLQFIITTHSPYILTSFNNLMQAGSLAKTLPKKKIKELDAIVPAAQRLDPDVVAAYVLEGGGGRSIIDPDTGLISAELIDRVSDDLAVQFGDLLELE